MDHFINNVYTKFVSQKLLVMSDYYIFYSKFIDNLFNPWTNVSTQRISSKAWNIINDKKGNELKLEINRQFNYRDEWFK